MAEDEPSSSSAPAQGEAPPTVNISIISPSLAVNAPLHFNGLAASTTVGQLKEKIRESLDARPANEQQRLIHQGKLLNRETETLLDVFGEQKLRGSDQVAIHLVIRDVDPQHSSTQAAPTRDQSPAPIPPPRPSALSGLNAAAPPHHHHPGHHHLPPLPPRFGGPAPQVGQPHSPFPAHGPGMPAPGSQTGAQLVAQQQQFVAQYLNQLNQRPLGHHGQQARGVAGLQGVPGHGQAINPQFTGLGHGRNSPHPEYQGYVRETVGPNGEVIRVTMNSAFIAPNGQVFPVNLQNLQQPGGPFSTNDVQNIIRNADASQATSIMTNAMHRSASGASLANLNLNGPRQPIQNPGVTVPRRPGSTVPLSRTATPDRSRTSSHGSVSAPPPNPSLRMPSTGQPEVYILSSPQGPRALLVHNQSDLYYTPAPRYQIPQAMPNFTSAWLQPPATQPRPAFVVDNAQQVGQPQPAVARAEQQAPQAGNVRVNIFQGAAAQQPAQQQQAQARPFAPAGPQFHAANPEGGLAGALLAALWPHIWLLVRLGVFVWWFTSSDTSWTRWMTIMAIATAVFLINTGILNGPANNLFNPIRRHLDGIIPLAPGEDVRPEGERNGGPQNREERNGVPYEIARDPRLAQQQNGPDPAQAAARLVAQRQQQNANWFVDQFRRLERAGLLFLASIAPGVAERHIQALAAQERAERERREAEERAERAERERREAEEHAAAEATASGPEGTVAPGERQNAESPETVGEGSEPQQEQHAPIAAA
ncbi:ubiquitin family protein [Diaporthe helianthi]|uniref:Ubiquitin family protein n=1 Tax=Diaporthe helianthi TaxID=158607 RepID=A0A2P5IA50_DIAHE|nr:ubiquitin family protein [Diaporthe helianthi]